MNKFGEVIENRFDEGKHSPGSKYIEQEVMPDDPVPPNRLGNIMDDGTMVRAESENVEAEDTVPHSTDAPEITSVDARLVPSEVPNEINAEELACMSSSVT
ncbi:MAG: hypothetical protein K2X60_10095 [Xanthobacteraceae bacterium]|nr:hypothetical protein [Xanthobacteraceae bacterium]